LSFFWGFAIVYNELKNDFMGRLELDFGGTGFEFGVSARSSHQQSTVEKCETVFKDLIEDLPL